MKRTLKMLCSREKNVVLNENIFEGKPCINIESKSLDLIIWLYLCYNEHEALSSCNNIVYLSGNSTK